MENTENKIKITLDGKTIYARKGSTIVEAARENGIYIPTLCHFEGADPKACCRICTVKINNRFMTSCTTPVSEGMEIENNTEEINDLRKSIVELLFVSGNHFCPTCEKSGNCELQALAYRFKMLVPRFPFSFPRKEVDASNPKIVKEQNRCILCKRCIKTIRDEEGRHYFAYKNRGQHLEVVLDPVLGADMPDELAKKAMENCPTGSILYKGKGFEQPIGTRKYDNQPIGSEIENQS
ncbi:(2Fe-2S)-binding protein [Candidatus Sulfidibacterium hydrothermale]|uniref:2Fe-2S iron-sulfur cluster-binding protein n=1 Tax=Candidatus Sulfidibacterium hydrothermale TaxID=2875962 RepID=UPI001F0AD370|nr:2Fe-2S iron-sulfur cluster-binding protein [Candidatus Sulfidibacterium hydrothermale]UBM61147.1 (2Fe-2S)-binding protein [Candidatus Sulfidibacterium hydrothermale]